MIITFFKSGIDYMKNNQFFTYFKLLHNIKQE